MSQEALVSTSARVLVCSSWQDARFLKHNPRPLHAVFCRRDTTLIKQFVVQKVSHWFGSFSAALCVTVQSGDLSWCMLHMAGCQVLIHRPRPLHSIFCVAPVLRVALERLAGRDNIARGACLNLAGF